MKLETESIRNWFGYSRRERRASFILLIIVIIILIIRVIVPEKNIDIEDISSSSENAVGVNQLNEVTSAKPVMFDPNIVTYDTLIRLGLAEKEARTLISYRNKGGKFRHPSDINKVYGIEGEKAEKLIKLVEFRNDTVKKSFASIKTPQKSLVDLNNCDTTQLVALPGIGRVLSVRIIKYRNLLGGFASVGQLHEIYGLPAETFELIKGRVYADSSVVHQIKINSVGYKELSRIPYFQKFEVSAILKYRELKGRIENMSVLTENKLISLETADKVRPYLNFE